MTRWWPRRITAPSVVLPVVLLLVVALAAVWWLRSDDGGAGTDLGDAVDVTASGPTYTSLDDLVEASDVVVYGTVVDVERGRAVTDPNDPEAGIRTQLAQVEPDTFVVGDIGGPLVVEQEATLLDGTPITVNGVSALSVGDRGVMFLVLGDGGDFPYTALVNEQAWVAEVDDALRPVDADDVIWQDWAGRSVTDLETALGR